MSVDEANLINASNDTIYFVRNVQYKLHAFLIAHSYLSLLVATPASELLPN